MMGKIFSLKIRKVTCYTLLFFGLEYSDKQCIYTGYRHDHGSLLTKLDCLIGTNLDTPPYYFICQNPIPF